MGTRGVQLEVRKLIPSRRTGPNRLFGEMALPFVSDPRNARQGVRKSRWGGRPRQVRGGMRQQYMVSNRETTSGAPSAVQRQERWAKRATRRRWRCGQGKRFLPGGVPIRTGLDPRQR